MSRKPLVGVSLKMYFDIADTTTYIQDVLSFLPSLSSLSIDIFLIPDFVSILSSRSLIGDAPLLLGAQDCYHEDHGPYTGEISPVSLAQAGCRFVEIGHAERRRLFGETDADVAKKAIAIARNGMVPLVCVGEERKGEVGAAVEECRLQLKSVLDALPEESEIVVAYEPVWAIGQTKPASVEHVVAVTKQLRNICDTRKGLVRILYGGSAGPGLFKQLAEGVDGLFLGRFAHDVDAFERVITEIAQRE